MLTVQMWERGRYRMGEKPGEGVNEMRLLKNRKGVTMIEYGLLAALIAVAAIVTLPAIGFKVNNAFQKVSNAL